MILEPQFEYINNPDQMENMTEKQLKEYVKFLQDKAHSEDIKLAEAKQLIAAKAILEIIQRARIL